MAARAAGVLVNSLKAVQRWWRDVPVSPSHVLEPRDYASSFVFSRRHARLRHAAVAARAGSADTIAVQAAFDEWGRMFQFYMALIGTGLVPRAKRHLQLAEKMAKEAHSAAKKAGVTMPGIPWYLDNPKVRDLVLDEKQKAEKFNEALQKGMAHNKDAMYVTESALAGLSEDMRSPWKESRTMYYFNGCKAGSYPSYRLKITRDSFDRLLPHCQNASLRKDFFRKYQAGFADIDTYALALIQARHRIAVALGYANHAEYELASMSVRTVANGNALLKQVFSEAEPYLKPLRKKVQEQAKKGNAGRPLEICDEITYRNILSKEAESWKLAVYMEVDIVLPKLLEAVGNAYQVKLEVCEDVDNFWSGFKKHVKILKATDASTVDGKHLGYVYLDLYQSTGWFGTAEQLLPGACLVSPGHVYVAMNGLAPPWYASKGFHYSEIIAMAHEFGHALHLLLYSGDVYALSEGELPTDVVELPSTLTETWILNPSVLGQLAQNKAGSHPPQHLLQPTQRDAWFYARLVQTSNVALRLHDFDPTNTTPAQLRQRAVDAWNEYNPNIASGDASFSPFSEDIGPMIACGADAIAYLLCHLNAHTILDKAKNSPSLAKVRPLLSREFPRLRAESRAGKSMLAPHPFKVPQNASILFTRAIRFA
eukprot:GEMP01021894.1.p1 GENE.GEMP01021894.1~~GEMP01021894.1.p1  ORF type:complete len:652 (+),score=169.23 GEMP01021894.1:229-2184(+)